MCHMLMCDCCFMSILAIKPYIIEENRQMILCIKLPIKNLAVEEISTVYLFSVLIPLLIHIRMFSMQFCYIIRDYDTI